MSSRKLMIVDDSRETRVLLKALATREGYDVVAYESATEMLGKLDTLDQFDAIILDIMMPEVDGFEALARIREVNTSVPVIVSSSLDDKESILRCLRLDASDYITKPVDATRFKASLTNATRSRELSTEIKRLESALSGMPGVSGVIGRSEAFKKSWTLLERVKDSEATVLLLGESGVGKEVLARALHFQSHRAKKPFVPVNCGALPEALLESELFGHEAGAFTGADKRRTGKFEAAGDGTVFLDEIGEMTLESQVKLLRVLQERKVVRLGGHEEVEVKARVVCATNKGLKELVDAGKFREDLYYRITAYPINIPSLRERGEDIPSLAEFFLKRYAQQEGKDMSGFDPAAMEAIEAYAWPGNVRQLENAIERAVLLADGGVITLDTLPDDLQPRLRASESSMRASTSLDIHEILDGDSDVTLDTARITQNISLPKSMPLGQTGSISFKDSEDVPPLHRIERAAILAALSACGGDIQDTARRLEISRATIYRRLRQYGIDPDAHRD